MNDTNKPSISSTNIAPRTAPLPPDASNGGAQVGQNDSTTFAQEGSQMASHLAGEARDLASHAATAAEELVNAELDKRTSRGADELSDVARALRQTGKELKGNMIGPYVEKAAAKIDDASDYLRTASPGKMMDSVSNFARRDPVLFLSGAFALGLLGSRFVKSGRASDDATPSGEGVDR